MRFRILIFALLLLPILIACNGKKDAKAEVEIVQLSTSEREREYYLYVPASIKNDNADHALVLVLHGGGGSAQFAVDEIGPSLFRLAEEDGFYVVFPQAINTLWDFGSGTVSEQLDERVDDRNYFSNLLDDVADRLTVDLDRIFATGISRGGQATYFISCEFPGRIRAIAPVAMPLPVHLQQVCESGPPVGVAFMNGTADPIVPYDGGLITIGDNTRDEVLSSADTITLWANRNGCDLSLETQSIINSANDNMQVEKSEWRDCTGPPVIFYSIVGGGHTWPSGEQYLPAAIVGRVNQDIDAAEEAWRFFAEFE